MDKNITISEDDMVELKKGNGLRIDTKDYDSVIIGFSGVYEEIINIE